MFPRVSTGTCGSDPHRSAHTTPTCIRSPGHYKEWVNACKGGKPCLSNFDYAAALTEAILLGVVALRAGKKIEYDAQSGKVTNVASANQFLAREYRKGWEL